MEEVDKIIIQTLRQIGCDIDEDVTSLREFDSDRVVNAAVRCLEIISPGLNLPHSLPPNMASKYRVGQEIAQACVDQGYRGDIGYQTFLYSGESDVRKILMFLVEKLPKEEEKFLREPTGSELLLKRIKCKVKEELNRPWLPFELRSDQVSYQFRSYTDIDASPTDAWRKFWRDDLPLGAIDQRHLLPTLITLHSRGVLTKYEPRWFVQKKPNLETVDKFSTDAVVTRSKPALPPKPKPREKIADLSVKAEEDEIAHEVEELQIVVENLKIKKQQTESELLREQQALQSEQDKNVLKAKIVELLPESDTNAHKLQSLIEQRTSKLINLAKQWEAHRLPLVQQYRDTVSQRTSKQTEIANKAETARTLGEKRRELETELRMKQQLLTQLVLEAERVGKEAHRSAYTRRILEIIGNVEKQKLEISKVLKDTQGVQKEINTLSGQLDRCFTVADETIFADAKKDETSRKAYKLLATLHTDCDQLVAMVQETGTALREIRDLEDQIEKERIKDVAGNLARITADLSQMQQESDALSTQLRLKAHKEQRKEEPS